MLLAQRGGHADNLAHATARAHHPHRAERLMGHADVAAGHEEVRDVPAVEAAVRRPIRCLILPKGRFGDELSPFLPLVEGWVRRVEVNSPGAGETGVGR